MIGRILWIAALIAVGGVTAALQLDREAGATPQLATLVPAPFRNDAQAQIAAAALERGDPAAALAAAETLVRRRPMPAEHLTLLAAAQAKAGEGGVADTTIRIAATRGWREPVAQQTMLRLALAAGDKAEAAHRFAALLRNNATPDSLLVELAPAVLGEPGGTGQQALAEVLAGAPRWHEMFLQRGAAVMPPATFGEVLALSLDRGAQFPCAPLKERLAGLAAVDPSAATRLAEAVARRCP